MNELRMAPSTVLRNSVRGIRNAWTFTPLAYSARLAVSTFLSSMVTSARSMSDFAHTISCDRLPQRMAARIDRSCFTCATRSSSASVNFFWMDPIEVLTLPVLLSARRQAHVNTSDDLQDGCAALFRRRVGATLSTVTGCLGELSGGL